MIVYILLTKLLNHILKKIHYKQDNNQTIK